MTVENTETYRAPTHVPSKSKKDRATEIANTFEWLITAFILAFVFRAFVMEAFRIPTGSMSDTLKGAHFRMRCQECGYDFSRGFVPQIFGFPADYVPKTRTNVMRAHCPSCGFSDRDQVVDPLELLVSNGDRILVLKCLYQFTEPKRWDVIVFKNPLNPAENYIKRLVGLPGETLELVDGDLFVNGKIVRKPPMVQEELWMPVYNHDYQPLHPEQPAFNGHRWVSPFDTGLSQWQSSPDSPTRFILNSPTQQVQSLPYGSPSANTFHAAYAYNSPYSRKQRPLASDLLMRFHAIPGPEKGFVGVELRKYGIIYQGRIHTDGTLSILREDPTGPTVLASRAGPVFNAKCPLDIRFCLVDQRLILNCDSQRLIADLDDSIETRKKRQDIAPSIAIQGTGQWILSHVAVYRDTHYTDHKTQPRKVFRGTEDHPFTLHQDEFFVLGDNSPNSEDARWWTPPHLASRGYAPPRTGVVPRDYLVGKAMFVYWPSGFEFPWPQSMHNWMENENASERGKNSSLQRLIRGKDDNSPLMRLVRAVARLRWIPNIGKMRYIYGGSDNHYVQSADDEV